MDDPARLRALAAALAEIAEERPVILPVHPRTRQRLLDCEVGLGRVQLLAPVGYLEMLDLIDGAFVVVTDSGGLQEETTALGVPCLTVRENTERPITIEEGTNRLAPDPSLLPGRVRTLRRGTSRPEGWDGRAGDRIVNARLARSRTVVPPRARRYNPPVFSQYCRNGRVRISAQYH